MTTFLRTRRFRGGVRHDFNLRDVKEEGVKLGNKHFIGGLENLQRPKFKSSCHFWHPTFNADCTGFRTGNGAR